MFKNYFKTTLRKLRSFKNYALINIIGLAINMTFSILITLFVWNEFSYDKFHEKIDRIYRVVSEWQISDQTLNFAAAPKKLAIDLTDKVSGITHVTRIAPHPKNLLIQYQEKKFYERNVLFADASIFEVFTFPLVAGDADVALTDPFSIVVTKQAAHRYFGDGPAVGKTLTLAGEYELKVTGVLEAIPANSHIGFDFLIPLGMLERLREGGDLSSRVRHYTYVLAAAGHEQSHLETQLTDFTGGHGMAPQSGSYQLRLQPLADIHLYSKLRYEMEPAGIDVRYLQILLLVAALLMLTAAINYTNMALAYSVSRAREIGVRKVVGASHKQLVSQFLFEPVLISCAALLMAFGLVELFQPAVSTLVGKEIAVSHWRDWRLLLGFTGGAVLIGLLSGCYPALVLSSFKAVNVLKGKVLPGSTKTKFREGLLVFQFAASIAIIVCTVVIFSQLNYIRSKNLGISKDAIVVVLLDNTRIAKKIQEFKIELLRKTNIVSATASSVTPGRGKVQETIGGPPVPGNIPIMNPLRLLAIDHDFISTYDIKVVEGRDFSKDHPSDKIDGVILNRTAVKELGLTSAVGSQVNALMRQRTIIGIVDDFHTASLHERIEPVALLIQPFLYKYISVKIQAVNISETLRKIEETWSEFTPEPFEYSFVDSDVEALYRAEQQLGRVFSILAMIAITTSCLGLFGLVAFISQQRAKEIAVRKVFGASVRKIVILLSKDFAWRVLIAGVVASPIAYWAMRTWLDTFAYRVFFNAWIPALAVFGVLIIALFTVSSKTIQVAKADPVKSLRYE